jgi:hypothetical protein
MEKLPLSLVSRKILQLDPSLAKKRSESPEPMLQVSIIERLEPNRTPPITETEEAHRAKERRDRVDPNE